MIFDMVSHVRGAFGDFGNIKCLYSTTSNLL